MAQTNARELAEAMGKPLMTRLKALGRGIKVGTVLGDRVLVKTVAPWTDADEVEKQGLLVVPKAVKDANQPLPTSGVILAVGEDVDTRYTKWRVRDAGGEIGEARYSEPRTEPLPKGCEWVPPCIYEGAMVFFSKFSGVDLAVDNEADLRILAVKELFCTLVPLDELAEVKAE